MGAVNSEAISGLVQAKDLGKVGETHVISPSEAAIPRPEGIHLEVKNGLGENPWVEADPKTLIKDGFVAVAVAKAVVEGRFTPEQWVNIHLSGRPDFNRGVNVFGRNPESANGWGKPVHYEPGQTQLSQDEARDLEHLFRLYLPRWEKTCPQVSLFTEGVEAILPEATEFQEEGQEYNLRNETLLWLNNKFALVLVNAPHLNGLHLVVHGRDRYWKDHGGFKRPWQSKLQPASEPIIEDISGSVKQPTAQTDLSQIIGFLEAEAILIGAQRVLLQEGGLPFYNPEIHFSSSWAPSLKTVEQGGKLNMDYLTDPNLEQARKNEKKVHRVGGNEEWDLGMHGHLYATRDADRYVLLPTRPQAEVPDQWKGIAPLSSDEAAKVKDLTQQKLTNWLTTNVTGGILPMPISQ